jgi:hypothetical protein
VPHEPAERPVTPFRFLERRAQVGGALLHDRPQQVGVGHDPGLDQVVAELLVLGAVEVVGQQVVPQHQLARHAERGEHDRGHPPGPVFPARAVVQQRQPPARAHQPHRGAERLSLPRVRHEAPVDLHHQRSRPPVAEFGPLPIVVAAGDQLVDRAEVAAADRQADQFDPERQPVRARQQDLARRPEVDHDTQPEPLEPFHVGAGQPAERVAAEQPPAADLQAVAGPVATDVPHVHRAVEHDVADWCPLGCHRARLIAHRPSCFATLSVTRQANNLDE